MSQVLFQPHGFFNIGNTCYFNAPLQCLKRTSLFVHFVSKVFSSITENGETASAETERDLPPATENTEPKWRPWNWFWRAVCLSVFGIGSRYLLPIQLLCSKFKNLLSSFALKASCIGERNLTFRDYLYSRQMCPARNACPGELMTWSDNRVLAIGAVIFIFVAKWLPVPFQYVYVYVAKVLSWIKNSLLIKPLQYCYDAFHLLIRPLQRFFDRFVKSPLSDTVKHALSSVRPSQKPKYVGVALKNVFDELNSTAFRYSVNPGSVLDAVSSRALRFAGHNQQDSHELLRHLLDGLRVDERQLNQSKQNMEKLTLVDKIFGGHFMTVYTCVHCNVVYSLCEPFLDISLPLVIHKDTLREVSGGASVSEEDLSQDVSDPIEGQEMYLLEHDVETLLKVYTRKENLGKEYLCNACNKDRTDGGYDLTEGTKEALIYDPPAVLCLHMKRFKEVPGAGCFEKVNAHITFSETLDLKPYLSKDCKRVDIEQKSVLYSLYGVVVHSGSLRGGHYVAYVKSLQQQMPIDKMKKFLQDEDFESQKIPIDRDNSDLKSTVVCGGNQQELNITNDWYCCSDTTVCRVDAREVFRQQAFLLFYERIC